MRVILLIIIGLSVLNAEITRDSNGIVTDTSTKLQWQDDTAVSSLQWEWEIAINHCESLILGEHSDWRLPNINELKSIVDRSKEIPAIVDGFVNTRTTYYWSSTTLTPENYKTHSWLISFYDGSSINGSKDSSCFVRCVRDGR